MARRASSAGERRSRTRPPSAWVVRDRAGATIDWSRWYLTDEEDRGQSPRQNVLIALIKACIDELARERGWTNVLVASDAFFAWVPQHPLVRVSPDVYLLDDPPPQQEWRGSWQTWQPGVQPPRFALEIVSVNWKKDYEDAPERYAQLGCRELVIFDPTAANRSRPPPRVALTVYRRQEDGAFELVTSGPGPVWSTELNAALVVTMTDGNVGLRVARDAAGTELVPTAAERAAAETRRADAEAQRRVEAERRIAALEAELARARSHK